MSEKKYEVVYNACYGGYGLSRKAAERLVQLGFEPADIDMKEQDKRPSVFGYTYNPDQNELPRHDLRLVQVVKELGKEASGNFAELKIARLSSNKYRIDEYDGNESVIEPSEDEWTVIE